MLADSLSPVERIYDAHICACSVKDERAHSTGKMLPGLLGVQRWRSVWTRKLSHDVSKISL